MQTGVPASAPQGSEMSREATNEWMPRTSVEKAINPHLKSLLSIEDRHETTRVQARDLLTPARLDVMAKYIYAVHKQLPGDSSWGAHVYREHLKVWNEFKESDASGKTSFDAYCRSYDDLLAGMARSGFDPNLGLVPVGSDGTIVDGAHRLAAALAYGRSVDIVRFRYDPPRYDYAYFRERGLTSEILDDMALQYCALDSRVRVAVVFPVAKGKDEQISQILEESRSVVYSKRVSFSKSGRMNLIRLLYRNEPWVGDGVKLTSGLLQHVESRFVGAEPVKFIFMVGADDASNRDAKERVRGLFNLGNDPIHISDTHGQTISIAESILNTNSIHFLNNAKAASFKHFSSLFRSFQEWIDGAGLERHRFCVDGSAVLAAYGLRDANDLDYLYVGDREPVSPDALIACHNSEAAHYSVGLGELVLNPGNHFYFHGLKFVSLQRIREMKAHRAEPKDVGDVYRIDTLQERVGLVGRALKWYYTFPERWATLRFQSLRAIKKAIPRPLLPLAQSIYRLPRKIRVTIGPRERRTQYRGFELHYSRGTSLVEDIQGGQVYEPEVTGRLVRELLRRNSATYLDVGANLGLMTLNVLAEVPDVKVVAFEPGPHQAQLLRKNIAANQLEGRVSVVQWALGNKPGTAQFVIHHDRHSSGDGFIDTGRAGRTVTIDVPVGTLDGWWVDAGRPGVDAIKIDTEGAELWVLQGAHDLLEKCRPVVVFELHPKNIRVYPYKAEDILEYFSRLGYEVQSLSGVRITAENVAESMMTSNDYVAVPDHE